ncbi:MAG: hypothetical protein Q8869_01285, partial [Candidatus Phytoplasma australasiaticum]|nr:hypothetical protein [Candidatus Phytoplasma australasiaticum]
MNSKIFFFKIKNNNKFLFFKFVLLVLLILLVVNINLLFVNAMDKELDSLETIELTTFLNKSEIKNFPNLKPFASDKNIAGPGPESTRVSTTDFGTSSLLTFLLATHHYTPLL